MSRFISMRHSQGVTCFSVCCSVCDTSPMSVRDITRVSTHINEARPTRDLFFPAVCLKEVCGGKKKDSSWACLIDVKRDSSQIALMNSYVCTVYT